MSVINHLSSCVHEPKVVIKTFSLDSDRVHYALCKDCATLKPFNEFLIKEEPFKEHDENFLSHREEI